MAKGYKWEEIKTKYETGRYSMGELSNEYGFNESYGRNKASKENWEKGKTNDKVTKVIQKQIIEEEGNKEYELRKEYEKIITNIRRGAYNTLFKEKDFDRLKQFKIASEIMTNCRKEQWEINEIQEVAKKIEQQLDIAEIPKITFKKTDS